MLSTARAFVKARPVVTICVRLVPSRFVLESVPVPPPPAAHTIEEALTAMAVALLCDAMSLGWHMLAWHKPPRQSCPQAPQLVGSCVLFTHIAPHACCPAGHEGGSTDISGKASVGVSARTSLRTASLCPESGPETLLSPPSWGETGAVVKSPRRVVHAAR